MRKIRRRKKSRPTIFLAILVVLGLGITVTANVFAFNGFHASSLEQKIRKLAEENKELEIKATSLKSLQTLQGSLESAGQLIPIVQMKYLEFAGTPDQEAVSQK